MHRFGYASTVVGVGRSAHADVNPHLANDADEPQRGQGVKLGAVTGTRPSAVRHHQYDQVICKALDADR